jgi:two-component system, cell cycle response regulator
MTVLHRVSLVGFGAFERATFDMFFRMAEQRARRSATTVVPGAQRQRGYVQTAAPEDAEVVLIDGEDKAAVERAYSWPGRCLSIGGRAALPGAVAHLKRPLNMTSLLKLLDQLMENGGRPLSTTTEDKPAAATGPQVSGPTGGTSDAEILVVDDSDIALKFMARCLQRHGISVQLARSGEEALQHVAHGQFAFVFLDVTMPGIDGYQTCKLIKKRPYLPGRKAPRVVMLTSRDGLVDKMRATLAGCDGYLTKPLQQDALLRLLRVHLLGANGFDTSTRSAPLSSILGL